MRVIIPLFFVLLTNCIQSTSGEQAANNESTKEVVELLNLNEQVDKPTFDYTPIIDNFPTVTSLTINSEQLQKSTYTKYHPERDLNNFYFELSEITTKDKEIVDIDGKENSRLFYYGRTKIKDSQIVIILKNDTTIEEIRDLYLAQLLDSSNKLMRTFELAKILMPEVEESTETTSEQIGTEIIRTTIYELYETPVDEEPLKRTEKKDTISLNWSEDNIRWAEMRQTAILPISVRTSSWISRRERSVLQSKVFFKALSTLNLPLYLRFFYPFNAR